MKLLLLVSICCASLLAQTGASNPPVRDIYCAATSGSATAYACTPTVAISSYLTVGMLYHMKADATNTGAATVNFGPGAKSIVKIPGGPTAALIAGDIQANQEVTMLYDGTNMVMTSPSGNAGAGSGCTTTGTNLQNGNGSGGCADSGVASTDVDRLGTAQTITAAKTYSANGAASAPSVIVSGAVFAGTGTTSVPLNYQNCSGSTQPSTWAVGGTVFGVNTCSGFAGNFIDFHANGGASLFSVSSGGTISTAANLSIGNGAFVRLGPTSTKLLAPADGQLELVNNAATGFTRIQFGGTTSSFPAFNVNSTSLEAKLADNSAYTGFLNGVDATVARATSSLPTCTATTGTPWRASVNDATAPAIGVALTGGGTIFSNVHCSLTTGTYIVDGI